jgi:hypothetical protein
MKIGQFRGDSNFFKLEILRKWRMDEIMVFAHLALYAKVLFIVGLKIGYSSSISIEQITFVTCALYNNEKKILSFIHCHSKVHVNLFCLHTIFQIAYFFVTGFERFDFEC